MERLTVSKNTVSQKDINRLLEFSDENQLGPNNAYYKLKHYEDLEEQELLIILPCKLGTPIYHVVPDLSVTWPDPIEYMIVSDCFRLSMIKSFGESVFLTKEEAEVARKEANKMNL